MKISHAEKVAIVLVVLVFLMTRFLPQVFAPIVTRQLPSEINPPPTAHPVANSSEYMITEASGNKHYSVTVSDGLGVTLSLYAYDADFTPVTETGLVLRAVLDTHDIMVILMSFVAGLMIYYLRKPISVPTVTLPIRE